MMRDERKSRKYLCETDQLFYFLICGVWCGELLFVFFLSLSVSPQDVTHWADMSGSVMLILSIMATTNLPAYQLAIFTRHHLSSDPVIIDITLGKLPADLVWSQVQFEIKYR